MNNHDGLMSFSFSSYKILYAQGRNQKAEKFVRGSSVSMRSIFSTTSYKVYGVRNSVTISVPTKNSPKLKQQVYGD